MENVRCKITNNQFERNSNNNQLNRVNGIATGSKADSNDGQANARLATTATANDVDNNECDSGESNSGSSVADDEQPSSSSNGISHNHHDHLSDRNLNGSHDVYYIVEPAIGSDRYLLCDDNFFNSEYKEEKIYEDLCYVPLNRSPFEVRHIICSLFVYLLNTHVIAHQHHRIFIQPHTHTHSIHFSIFACCARVCVCVCISCNLVVIL